LDSVEDYDPDQLLNYQLTNYQLTNYQPPNGYNAPFLEVGSWKLEVGS